MKKRASEQEHVRHFLHKTCNQDVYFWTFHVAVVQNNGKEMYKKSVLHVQSCFFFLPVRLIAGCLFVCLFFFYRSRCLRCLAFQTERNVTKRQVIHNGSLGSLCGDFHELLANQADATKCTLCERTGRTW